MINKLIESLRNQLTALQQSTMPLPQVIRIKEFFPVENAVTIEFQQAKTGIHTPMDSYGQHKFPLAHRGDISESMGPQPGDLGLLLYTGSQYKKGIVLLTHTSGGEKAMTYTPVRGGWAS